MALDKMARNIGIRVYPTPDGLPAPDFLDVANNLVRLISEVDIMVSGELTRTVDWKIAQLSYGSPATLLLEPIVREGKQDNRDTILHTVLQGIDSLKDKDERPKYFSDEALKSAQILSLHMIDNIERLEVFSEDRAIVFSDTIARNVKTILKPGRDLLGSIEGYLEAMSSHEGFKFAIYEPVMGLRIPCVLAEGAELNLKQKVIDSYEKKVRVSGILRTNIKGEVRSAKVNYLEILRTEAILRHVDEIAGIFDITGGISAEEYVRSMRDA